PRRTRIDAVGRVGRGPGERSDAGPQVLAADHELAPEHQQVPAGPEQAPEIEKRGLAERAVVVTHRHLDDAEAAVLNLLHHLDADDPARLFEVDALENGASQQAEIAVDVAQLQAEQEADDVVVDPSDEDAVQRIGAADLVAVHEIRVRRHAAP